MAINELKALLSGKDSDGNTNLIYPITLLDCVDGAGSLSDLATTEKSDLVAAINELVNRIASLSGITYVASTDNANLVSIRDMESGTYVFYGKFKPYAASTSTLTFSSKLLVNIVKRTADTQVMVFYPVNNCVQYLKITDDTYERKNIYLNDLMASVDTLETSVGTMSDLTTNDRTSLVAAVNELAARPTDVVKYSVQKLLEDQKAQARENIGALSHSEFEDYTALDNPDIHADYFTITNDGVVSLRPEYRGAGPQASYAYSVSDMGVNVNGSKNTDLPDTLVIPEIVDGKAVQSLAQAIFRNNLSIKNVVLPSTIDEIPERCFDLCYNLVNLYNTENIKTIGRVAFQGTSIKRLNFPILESLADTAFTKCACMVYADIGKTIKSLPNKTFNECFSLNWIKCSSDITSVGDQCFSLTPNLKHIGFVPELTNIGKAAFLCSGMEYDWGTLANCTFGEDATPLQYNPIDFWSACTVTPCENRLPTLLSQSDPRWTNRNIGTTSIKYSAGCNLMCAMHIYCALHDIVLSSVAEFEEIVNEINPGLLNTYTQSMSDSKAFMEGLGLTVERYTTYDQSVLQTLYNALAAGKYATISLVGNSTTLSHVLTVYGVNEDGELLLADSIARNKSALDKATRYSLPYHKLTASNYYNWPILHIVSL